MTVRAGCISAGLSHSRGKQLAGFRDPLLQRFSQAPHQLTTPVAGFLVPGSWFLVPLFRVPGSALRLAGLASGGDDLSCCHNAKYLLVFRQSLDEVPHVGKLTLTVPLDCFLARPTCRAGDAVKLMDQHVIVHLVIVHLAILSRSCRIRLPCAARRRASICYPFIGARTGGDLSYLPLNNSPKPPIRPAQDVSRPAQFVCEPLAQCQRWDMPKASQKPHLKLAPQRVRTIGTTIAMPHCHRGRGGREKDLIASAGWRIEDSRQGQDQWHHGSRPGGCAVWQ